MAPSATRMPSPAPRSDRRREGPGTRILLIRDIGIAGAELGGDVAVVFRALVDILDQQRNRRASGMVLIHAREDLTWSDSCRWCGIWTGRGGAGQETAGYQPR